MTKQLLFYDTAIPVSKTRHGDLSIGDANYEFASEVNSVPLTAVEIPLAAREYTVVFAGDETITPVVLLGVKNNENVYVSSDGLWNADYIPAFVRRYPFVFSLSEDKQRFTLCIDESWTACQRSADGRRLFDDKGEQTEFLNQMLKFLEEYQAHYNRTQTFCERIKALDILEPMKADFTLADGTAHALGGFMAVNRDKLKALPSEKIQEMLNSDELELVFNHLYSMNNLRSVATRASDRTPPASVDSKMVDESDSKPSTPHVKKEATGSKKAKPAAAK